MGRQESSSGYDLLVVDGRVVTPAGVVHTTIAIMEGRIADLGVPPDAPAARRIDAAGAVVLPGLVDPHAHFWDPGATHREDWAHGSRSALAGGVTTVVEMPLSVPPTVDDAALDLKISRVHEHSVVDTALWGGVVPTDPGQLADRMRSLAARGVRSFKVFMCDAAAEFPACGLADLERVLALAVELDVVVGVHAEDAGLIHEAEAKLQAAGRTDPLAYAASRTVHSEVAAVRQVVDAAITAGARLYIVHMSAADAVDVLVNARRNGLDGYVETCPHYLVLDTTDLERRGPWAKCAPPLRDAENVDRMWDRVLAGDVDTIGSDHAPFSAEEKQAGEAKIWDAPNGLTGIQTMLPLLIDEGIHHRGLTWEALARLTSSKAATIFGLDRKGRIEVGADADLVLVDPDQEWVIRGGDLLSKETWTPYEGRRVRGCVSTTVSRGRVVYDDGQIVAAPGSGELLGLGGAGENTTTTTAGSRTVGTDV